MSRFGLKMGIDFDHFCLKLCMVFKGTKRYIQAIKREREVSKNII